MEEKDRTKQTERTNELLNVKCGAEKMSEICQKHYANNTPQNVYQMW